MEIHVVTIGSYSNYRIITATIDKNLAKQIAKKFTTEYDEAHVETFEDAEVMLKPCWFVRFDTDGSVRDISSKSNSAYHYKTINKCDRDSTGGVIVSVLADDSSAAIKIAAEKRAQYLAEKEGIS